MRKIIMIFGLAFSLLLTSCDDAKDNPANLVVVVKYKALPNKSVDAVTGLRKLIERVEKEDHFVSLKLHIDQKDNSNILLYEVWDDELYYRNQHMKTEHLQEFIVESQAFLAGPPEISYWKVNAVYD